jgi:hypothetical protein
MGMEAAAKKEGRGRGHRWRSDASAGKEMRGRNIEGGDQGQRWGGAEGEEGSAGGHSWACGSGAMGDIGERLMLLLRCCCC